MPDRPVAPMAGRFQTNWREIGLWSAAAVVAIGVHAGAGWYGYSYQSDANGGEVAAAVMIDMEPLPAPIVPEAVAELPPVEPEKVTPEPVQQEAAAPEIQPEKPVEPEPQPTPEEQVVPEKVQPEETVELPKVEVPLPVVKPEPKKEVPKKVVRKPVKTVVADIKSDTVVEAKQQPSISRAASARAAQSWGQKINSYLARYARRPGGRNHGAGSARVALTFTRSGDITSSRIAVSSGKPELDQYILDVVRRASPVPSAPDDFTGGSQSTAVTITIQ
ncbi:TonB family protein [Phyllobacterium sp. OV277]|uniref:TonB family protein n=1 Tax=Phyllobacterium sp. OV277 TaxID=1882772 RepID=UPI000B804663|nr:TonB family protein [Phyllobacterium sp. OV277]